MTIEQDSLMLKREAQIVAGRNAQRGISSDLSPAKKLQEKRVMDRLLDHEQILFSRMNLIDCPLGEITVNPDLTTFLDGSDGLGGYADIYAREEYLAPGTKLEMDLKKELSRNICDQF